MTAIRPSSARSNCLFYYYALKLNLIFLKLMPLVVPYPDIIYLVEGSPVDFIIDPAFTLNHPEFALSNRAKINHKLVGGNAGMVFDTVTRRI
jgi:hypothetical protein